MLTKGLYTIGVLFLLEKVFPLEIITKWVWYLLLWLVVIIIFKRQEFYRSRSLVIAVLPLILVSFFSNLIIVLNSNISATVNKVEDFANAVAITWMIAMLIVWFRQEKVLKKEHKKRLAEEEHNRIIEARRAELEVMVSERTAELTQQKEELQQALTHLESTQLQLVQREKMASLGELTAGIAHEIQNPLNFVNNFSELNVELANELQQEIHHLPASAAAKEALYPLLQSMIQNGQKIAHHGHRADAIVKGMLLHSRKNTGQKEATNINALADEYLRLSYHGLRAKDKSFNATLQTHYDERIESINVIPQDMGRVLLNLFNNAFYAVSEKKNGLNGQYEPTVSVQTGKEKDHIVIRIKDNGMGIPQEIKDKIFQPFFTTKPTGQGTGLGLSLSYDIIKAHGGELKVETKEGEGAEFIIQL
jgi:signal transduction histidine kinase